MRRNLLRWWLPDVTALLRDRCVASKPAWQTDSPTRGLFAVALSAALGSALLNAPLGTRGSLLVGAGVLGLVFRPMLDRLVRASPWSVYQAVESTWMLALLGVLSAWGAWFAINLAGFRRDVLLPEFAPPWFAAAFLGVPVVVWGVSRAGRARAGWWTRGERLRCAARVTWAATALLVCAAFASRRPEFDPHRYIKTLPRLGFDRAVSSLPEVDASLEERPAEVHEGRIEDLVVRAVCKAESWCGVSIAQTPRAGERSNPWRIWGVWVKRDEVLDVRRDRARGLLFVPRPRAIRVLRARDGERIDVPASAFGEHAGPPRPWVFGAAIGLALAAWILRRRDRVPVGTWTPALARDGLVWCEDGASFRVVSALSVSGPVLVEGELRPVGVYRENGEIDAARVYRGTPQDLACAVHASAITHDAVAFATLVLTSAPLWTAAMRGMVW